MGMKNTWFVLFWFVAVLIACTREKSPGEEHVHTSLILYPGHSPLTRAASPDEDKLTDCNILVFNAYGDLEQQYYLSIRDTLRCSLELLKDVPYTFLAAANLGYKLPAMTLAEARQYRYHLAYPDEYSRGLPMAALAQNQLPAEKLELHLERLMARLDLRLDRRKMEEDALMKVTEVTIGLCPQSATLFPGSCVETVTQTFSRGFTLRGNELDALNRDMPDALSGIASLYLLENCSQQHPSYIEIKAEYHSADFHTAPGEPLTYRFPLGDIVRNTVYPVTVLIDF